MPKWIRDRFRDDRTSWGTAVQIMSVVGFVCGAVGIARILLAYRW